MTRSEANVRSPAVDRQGDPSSESPKPKLSIRATKAGWVCLFLLVWIPAAAVMTINNYLFIVFGLLVGTVITSHVLAKRNIRAAQVVRIFPDEIFAGGPFTLRYTARATEDGWGAAALELTEPSLDGGGEAVHITRMWGSESVSVSRTASLPRRGDHEIAPPRLSSSFPFGLAVYSTDADRPRTVLVFPTIESIDDEIPHMVGDRGARIEKIDPFGTVPYYFREYSPGDPYKYIDWKKSARTGELVTRVMAEEGAREITVRLPANPTERAISRAASLIVHFGDRGGPITLLGPGFARGPGTGREFTRSLLTALARWERRNEATPQAAPRFGPIVDVDRRGEYRWKGSA